MMPSGDTTWRDALLLDAPRIAGYQVLPLSAWHCHVAQLLDVRMGECDDGRGPTPGDVANAIAICRSIYRPGRSGVPVAGRWIRFCLRLRWWVVDWRRDAGMFCRYVEAYRRYPEVTRKSDKEGSPMGAPPYYAVAVDVASRMPSVTLTEALNMPLGSLYCLRATLLELDGGSACAWGTKGDPDDVQAALAAAQQAIARFNEGKGAVNGKFQD